MTTLFAWLVAFLASALVNGLLFAVGWNVSVSRVFGVRMLNPAEGFIVWMFVGWLTGRYKVDDEPIPPLGEAFLNTLRNWVMWLLLILLMLAAGLFIGSATPVG